MKAKTTLNSALLLAAQLTAAGSLTAATAAIQRALAASGLRFWPPEELIATFERHGLQTTWSKQHGLVLFIQSVLDRVSNSVLPDT